MSDKNFWKNFGKLTPHPELGPKSEIKILGKNLENWDGLLIFIFKRKL